MSGKGSKRRPMMVDQKTFETNWDLIFNKEKSAPALAREHAEKSLTGMDKVMDELKKLHK